MSALRGWIHTSIQAQTHTLTHTHGWEEDQNSSGEREVRWWGLPYKIFIASSFKSIQLFRGSQASTVRNWAGPVVITSLLISTDDLLAMGSAWLVHWNTRPFPSLQPISMFYPHPPIMEHIEIHLGIEPQAFITREFICKKFSFWKCPSSLSHFIPVSAPISTVAFSAWQARVSLSVSRLIFSARML